MSDLENFTVSENNEGSDSGALERLREKMAQASAQIKKDQKQEASQVKKDDVLFNVLMEFLKHFPANHPVVKAVVNCLSANLPSTVILAVLSLNYKTIQKAIKNIITSKENLPSLNLPEKFQSFTELISWADLVTYTIQSAKESDKQRLFTEQGLNKYLTGLIVVNLTEFLNNQQEITTEQVSLYTQDIVDFIQNNSKKVTSLNEPDSRD